MPSETEIVPNCIAKPPPSVTPRFAASASRASDRLHGVISFQEDAMPICGLSTSASVSPTARSIARAGARRSPSVTSPLRGLLVLMTSNLGGTYAGAVPTSFEFPSADGRCIRVWRGDGGQPDCVPLVISNGLGTIPEAWPALVRADSRYRAVTWYHRGTFGSARPVAGTWRAWRPPGPTGAAPAGTGRRTPHGAPARPRMHAWSRFWSPRGST